MTCNLIVPQGKVKFVFYDEENDKKSKKWVKKFPCWEIMMILQITTM